jgi:transcriptional regulator with XRE-family HTH domain
MNRIRELRNQKGLSQKQLGEQLGVTLQAVSGWERDERRPDLSTIDNLCRVLETTFDYMFCKTEENNYERISDRELEEKLKEAKRLYALYAAAGPKAQLAVEALLGFERSSPESPDSQTDKPQ